MNWLNFNAKNATFEIVEEYAVMVRFLGCDEDVGREMLTLQRALDPQDDKQGIDGVCLEREGRRQFFSAQVCCIAA